MIVSKYKPGQRFVPLVELNVEIDHLTIIKICPDDGRCYTVTIHNTDNTSLTGDIYEDYIDSYYEPSHLKEIRDLFNDNL